MISYHFFDDVTQNKIFLLENSLIWKWKDLEVNFINTAS